MESLPPTRPPSFEWSTEDAAHLGPSRITITRFYQRAPKAPYHRLDSQFKLPAKQRVSPGPKKKKRCVALDAAPGPSPDCDDWSDLSDHDTAVAVAPSPRFSSAPPEEIVPPESRVEPRINDDTAILQAFLSRAKANKRSIPIAKRESLENRRDSDVVRQALASTEKPDVLGEIDVNSPVRQSSSSPDQERPQTEAERPAPAQSKPPRRTLRPRARLSSPVKPAKITIRSAADQVALRRTEAQELASVTRSNTRKNKGKSFAPIVRLQKLADEEAPDDVPAGETSAKASVQNGVKWDETLVYYQEATAELEVVLDVPSPATTKSKSRRAKPTTLDTPKEDAPEPPPVEQPPRPQPTTKRKSRIATPARPSRFAAAPAVPSASQLPTLQPQHPVSDKTTTEAKESRFGTPKKPSSAAASTSLTGIKAASLPPRPDFAPPAAPVTTSVTTTITTSLPGLASPAKKRARPTPTTNKSAVRPLQQQQQQQRESESLPGLTSPTKRKRAGIKFS